MRSAKEWQQQIDHEVGANHPLYGMLSELVGDWEQCHEVWTALINDMSARVDADRRKLETIRSLIS